GNTKICLLETTTPAADFRKFTFKRVAFPSVFRSEVIASKPTIRPGFVVATTSPFYTGSLAAPSPIFSRGGNGASPTLTRHASSPNGTNQAATGVLHNPAAPAFPKPTAPA